MMKKDYAKIFITESTETLNEMSRSSSSETYEAFIKPFVDVLSVAKMALKDIGVGVLYNLRMLFTFNATKKKRLLEGYRQKMDVYEKEWDSTMEKIGGTKEADLILWMAAPIPMLAVTAVSKGVKSAEFVNDVFREQRLAMQDGGQGADGKPTGLPPGPLSGLKNDLKRLFFGESYYVGKILEQQGETPDIEAEIAMAMENIDIDPEDIKTGFRDWVNAKEDAIKVIESDGILDRRQALLSMMAASNFESLRESVEFAKSLEIDLGNYIKDFESELSLKREEILVSFRDQVSDADETEEPEIIQSLREIPRIKKLGDKATKEDFIDALQDALFNNLKKALQEDANRILEEIEEDIDELAEFLLTPFESTESLGELKNLNKDGYEIAGKIENIVNKITQ